MELMFSVYCMEIHLNLQPGRFLFFLFLFSILHRFAFWNTHLSYYHFYLICQKNQS